LIRIFVYVVVFYRFFRFIGQNWASYEKYHLTNENLKHFSFPEKAKWLHFRLIIP